MYYIFFNFQMNVCNLHHWFKCNFLNLSNLNACNFNI